MEKTIYLAGGCFWGTAKLFSLVPGVISTVAGYANSTVSDPSYEQVCTGRTHAAETVKVTYDADRVGLTDLLRLYFKSIDPLAVDHQGADIGTQYRTGIYYTDPGDLPVIEAEMATMQRRLQEPLAVECQPIENFYAAEDYHQGYLDKNPGGYCHVSKQLFEQARHLTAASAARNEELRSRLTPLQWEVTQHSATERPFDNEYDAEFREGIYVDVTDGTPLFLSCDKFNSGCGWPAFSRPIGEESVRQRADYSYGRTRTEVRSASSEAHLGHLFDDGPKELGGMRYCINSASLRFIPRERMEAEGYGQYIPMLDRRS